jgi:CheY-like chemotaxis protein
VPCFRPFTTTGEVPPGMSAARGNLVLGHNAVMPEFEMLNKTRMTEIRIFLAEDHEGDVFLVKRALGQMSRGYNLTLARNGEEALTILNALEVAAENDRPDVIVLDLNLPRVGGIELLARIRQVMCFHDTPVVVFTSSDSPRDRKTALDLGATRYVRKPIDFGASRTLGTIIEELAGSRA